MTRRRLRILIRGTGLAAVTAAKLLHDRGAEVRLARMPGSSGRIIAVPAETLALAGSLFGVELARLPIGVRVDARCVDWSGDGNALVPQVALVCDAGELAAVLAAPLMMAVAGMQEDDADWIVEATGRGTGIAAAAGERVGQFVHITNIGQEPWTTIAATPHGWIFTAPHPHGGLAVWMVMPSATRAAISPEMVCERLEAVGRQINPDDIVAITQPVPVTPGLSERLIATHHIRVGDAAMALDPLRGDGSGFALRGALLAQAVIAAINAGLAREACFEHYEQRLQNVFLSHLRGCSAHYRTARYASIWERDIAAMDCLAATVGLKQKLPVLGLQGFNLVPLGHHRLAAKRPSVS